MNRGGPAGIAKILAVMVLPPLIAGCGFFGPRVRPRVSLAGEQIGNYTLFHLHRKIQELALFLNVTARTENISPRTWDLTPAKPGRRLLEAPTIQKALQAPTGIRIQPVLRRIEPAAYHGPWPQAIGGYRTSLKNAQAPKVHNLATAAAAIDCLTVPAGAVFSLNALVDTPAIRRRYQPAPIIGDGGETKLESGGGICQLATTLYNAVLAAGLPVVERHPHSQPVTYVPAGLDATIYTDKDFRFWNNRRDPLKIRANVIAGEVIVNLIVLNKRKIQSQAE